VARAGVTTFYTPSKYESLIVKLGSSVINDPMARYGVIVP
jgi:hypothetical protein